MCRVSLHSFSGWPKQNDANYFLLTVSFIQPSISHYTLGLWHACWWILSVQRWRRWSLPLNECWVYQRGSTIKRWEEYSKTSTLKGMNPSVACCCPGIKSESLDWLSRASRIPGIKAFCQLSSLISPKSTDCPCSRHPCSFSASLLPPAVPHDTAPA